MKSILALAGGTARLEATLATALLAARRLDARLSVLHVRAEAEQLAYYAGDMVVPVPMGGQSVEDAEEIIAERETRARAVFDKVLGGEPVAPTGLVDYLACGGARAVVEAFDRGSTSARSRGRGLLQHARGMKAALLVMGA